MEKIADINVNCNNSIKLSGSKIIYIDPFRIEEKINDADYIFCTHSHYDHFSKEDILKIKKENTKIITVKSSKEDAENIVGKENVFIVKPNEEYKIDEIKFKTTRAYNVGKPFHPKENNWVGYIITLDDMTYYIAGDTDDLEELHGLDVDVAFLPVGGTYTMDYKEAANLANNINSKIYIPTHYGAVAGDIEDGNRFKKLLNGKQIKILIK